MSSASRIAVMVESPVTGAGADGARLLAEYGVRTVVLAHDPSLMPDYLVRQLDQCGAEVVQVDTQDVEAMLNVVSRLTAHEELAGVLSFYEYYTVQAAELAQRLGQATADPSAVARCRDKGRQRDALRGTPYSIPYARCASTPDAVAAARRIGFPVVVKPTNLTGSVMVRVCTSEDEVAAAADAVWSSGHYLGVPVGREVVIEEQVDGPEFSVEMMNGTVVAITEKSLKAGTVIEIAHTVPAVIDEQVASAIGEAAAATCRTLGLHWGPAHVEVRVPPQSEGRVVVIEVNARVAGDRIPELVRLALGVDLVHAQVRGVLGLPVDVTATADDTAAIAFVTGPGGVLVGIDGIKTATADPAVREVHVRIAEGQHHRLNGSNQDRVAWAIASAPRGGPARSTAEAALAALRLEWAVAGGDAL